MAQQDKESPVTVERAIRIGQLIDLYGALLTERQRQFIKLHYEDDLSFGEIAKEFNVSRQAVHDAVKHAETSLEEYASKLGTAPAAGKRSAPVVREAAVKTAPASGEEAAKVAGLGPTIEILEAIHDRLRRSGGVIYNVDGIARDLGDAVEKLERLSSDE